jgi:hypothetical protein
MNRISFQLREYLEDQCRHPWHCKPVDSDRRVMPCKEPITFRNQTFNPPKRIPMSIEKNTPRKEIPGDVFTAPCSGNTESLLQVIIMHLVAFEQNTQGGQLEFAFSETTELTSKDRFERIVGEMLKREAVSGVIK